MPDPNPWDEVKDATISVVKDALKNFVERADVDKFAREKAEQYAKQWWISTNGKTEQERAEAVANLEHLKAQIKGEFDRLQIQISVDAKNTIIKILETVGGILIKVAPKILAAI